MTPNTEAARKSAKGAWNTARKVSASWKRRQEGGRNGEFREIIKPILENRRREARFYFFPWHADPTCVGFTGEVTRCGEYFRSIEANQTTSAEQKKVGRPRPRSASITKTEFLSTLDEALEQPRPASRFSIEALDWMEKQMRDTPPLRRHVKFDENPACISLCAGGIGA